MKFITRDTDYAIRTLIYIASAGKNKKDIVVSADTISKELDLPKQHLRLLLKKLKTEGILLSYNGKNGGFTLAKKPDKIDLFCIIKIFQNNINHVECTLKKEKCPNIRKNCKMRKIFMQMNKDMIKKYKSLTINLLY